MSRALIVLLWLGMQGPVITDPHLIEIDVPAVPKIKHTIHGPEDGYWEIWDEETTGWHCKDKRRILMRDEQDPPKYWCHKVSP